MKFLAASPFAWVVAKAYAPFVPYAPFAPYAPYAPFALIAAFAPSASRAKRAVSAAVARGHAVAATGGDEAPTYQPFSCISSGRAKACDVEAARRYYVGLDHET